MAYPTLSPTATTSAITLPSGSNPVVAEEASYPFSVYTSDQYFLSGAADQIEYTYRKLGGDVLIIQFTSIRCLSGSRTRIFLSSQHSPSKERNWRSFRRQNRFF